MATISEQAFDANPSEHPVYERKGDEQVFWWRTPVSTDRIDDPDELDRIIARRWGR